MDQSEYNRQYFAARYANDPEFRARRLAYNREYSAKKKAARAAALQEIHRQEINHNPNSGMVHV